MKKLFCVCFLILLSVYTYGQPVIDSQFFNAVEYNHINMFIENGNIFNVDVNGKDQEGNTLLHYAAEYGQLEIARLLILVDANPHLPNRQAQTPLQIAIEVRNEYRSLFCEVFANCVAYINNVGNIRNRILEFNAERWFDAHIRQVAMVSLFREPIRPVASNSSDSGEVTPLITDLTQKPFNKERLI